MASAAVTWARRPHDQRDRRTLHRPVLARLHVKEAQVERRDCRHSVVEGAHGLREHGAAVPHDRRRRRIRHLEVFYKTALRMQGRRGDIAERLRAANADGERDRIADVDRGRCRRRLDAVGTDQSREAGRARLRQGQHLQVQFIGGDDQLARRLAAER